MGLGSKAGQAKMLGTILCVGGAMLLSFYHGSIVPIDQPNIHWKYAQDMTQNKSTTTHENFILGPFLLIISAVSWGIWSILQVTNFIFHQDFNFYYSIDILLLLLLFLVRQN